MTVSFVAEFGKHSPTDTASSVEANSTVCEQTRRLPVGEALHRLTDAERAAAIERAGMLIVASMEEWERSGCFAARGRAVYAEQCMSRLIKGRSPDMVARMERERGLM